MSLNTLNAKSLSEFDLRLLKIFKTVVECGGFTAAEEQLGVTKSTISVHMSNLETRMGLNLCKRGRAGFSLTEEGQEVYHALREMLNSIDKFSTRVSSLGKELSGELIILCTDQLSGKYQQRLANVIELIHEKAPELQLVLEIDILANIETELLKDKAHVGLLPPYHNIDGLEYSPLASEPIYLCCGKRHSLYSVSDTSINDEELFSQSLVHPGIEIDRAGQSQLARFKSSARAYHFDTRKVLIQSGKYLGYMPQSQIQAELNKGDLRLIKPDHLNYTFDISLVTKSLPREQRKIELLRQCFNSAFYS